MRKPLFFSALVAVSALLFAGCSGPSYKLGRGINNMTEFARGGDMRRSMEQAALWHGPDAAYTAGFIEGINRSFMRTLLGVAEVATFPIPTPTYDAFYLTENAGKEDVYVGGPLRSKQIFSIDFMTESPRYPDSYAPGLMSDSIFATDTALGYAAGDAFPFVPGSRFHVFDF